MALTALAAQGQESPFPMPKPLGGPIIGLDGRVISALDKGPPPWTGGIEVGLNGAEGNTDILKLNTGLDVRYDTPDNFFMANALYILTVLDDGVVQQTALSVTRNELPIDNMWAWYVQGQIEYDEFRNIDFRIAGHNGISMAVVRSPNSLLKVRVGAGVARETGRSIFDWVPEGQAGGDVEYLLSTRSKFCASVDYYPDLHELSQYRIRVRACVDLLIDPDLNAFLRFGIVDRYDSDPMGSKRNDLNYYLSLLIRF